MEFNIVVAYSFPSGGIGNKGVIPWHIPDDLRNFKKITESGKYGINTVIMGRKTWDSLPEKYKPLPNRINIVITRNQELIDNQQKPEIDKDMSRPIFCKFEDIELVISNLNIVFELGYHFIIGGGEIYKLALDKLNIENVYATEVYMPTEPEFDASFPNLFKDYNFQLTNYRGVSQFMRLGDTDTYFRYLKFVNLVRNYADDTNPWINKEEVRYFDLMQEILAQPVRTDRTGVGTHSIFGKQLEYDLRDTFPLSTTKRMFFRGIFEELMMYLRGQTDSTILNSKGVRVWDANTTRQFLDSRGLPQYAVGDMGSTYGFNFRHFGADYRGCCESYEGQGFDQLAEVIRLLKTDPTSRRIIINLWNPVANAGAALPACLCMYQFYVRNGEFLDLQIYIRSSDYFLANNWNTCTGALLVHLLCSLEGINYKAGNLSVVMGDTHIYKFHESQVELNLKRTPYPFPKLVVKGRKERIEEFQFEDLLLVGYRAHPRIEAPMAV